VNPNQQQSEAWNGSESVHYVDHADRYDRQLEPIANALIERAGIGPLHAVLDVGCGCGVTTLAAARTARSAVGVDISDPLVQVAIDRAQLASLENVDFLVADAQTHDFDEGAFDVVISQFGLMFFDDPVAAFSNHRRALTPGGKNIFATWQGLGANDWLAPVVSAVAQFTEVPDLGGLPNGPGMFALKDGSEAAELLEAAGFSDVAVESISPSLLVGGGGSLEESADFLFGMGIVRGLLSRLDAEQHETATAAIRAELERHYEPGEGVQLGAGVLLISAHS
jgi:SAM-dependent methyltransferase